MKKIKITLYALAIVMLAVFMGISFTNVNVYDTEVTTVVEVTDGVASKEGFEQTIVLKNDGTYRMYADWKTEPAGMITGFEFLNKKGESYNTFTAEWISMQSGLIEMPAGEYTLKATYLTNKDAVAEVFENTKSIYEEWDVPVSEDFEDFEYEFASDGIFETTYHFALKRDIPVFGISVVCGLLIGFFLVAIFITLALKGEDKKAKYDERQELVRGRGFKYAFAGFLGYNIVVYALDLLGINLHMSLSISALLCALTGITIYAGYCIWNDGYFALNQNKGIVLAVIGVGGILNLALGIWTIVDGAMLINGQLSVRSMNLFCGIMCIVVWSIMLAKYIKDRKEA